MNNIYLNNDPLLSQSLSKSEFMQPNQYNNYQDEVNRLYQRLNTELPSPKDWIGELNQEILNIPQETVQSLINDSEYSQLNSDIQNAIQDEILNLVKRKINSNPILVEKIKKQLEIIHKAENQAKEIEKQNIMELNDYMQNFSHLTFNEYKKLKKGETTSNNNEKTNKTKKK